jgi:hypothetical protein
VLRGQSIVERRERGTFTGHLLRGETTLARGPHPARVERRASKDATSPDTMISVSKAQVAAAFGWTPRVIHRTSARANAFSGRGANLSTERDEAGDRKVFFARPSPRHPSRDSLASLRARGFGHAFVSDTRFDLAIWVHRSTRRLLVMDESILSAAEAAHSPSGQSARTDLGEKDVAEARNSSTSESSLRNEASRTPLGKKGAEGSDS